MTNASENPKDSVKIIVAPFERLNIAKNSVINGKQFNAKNTNIKPNPNKTSI